MARGRVRDAAGADVSDAPVPAGMVIVVACVSLIAEPGGPMIPPGELLEVPADDAADLVARGFARIAE